MTGVGRPLGQRVDKPAAAVLAAQGADGYELTRSELREVNRASSVCIRGSISFRGRHIFRQCRKEWNQRYTQITFERLRSEQYRGRPKIQKAEALRPISADRLSPLRVWITARESFTTETQRYYIDHRSNSLCHCVSVVKLATLRIPSLGWTSRTVVRPPRVLRIFA